jgi:phosphate starvation-inducible protein PhoH and related proteins
MTQTKRHRQESNFKIRIDNLCTFDPLTNNQQVAWDEWKDGHHLVLNGSAGTGKTFTALYLALQDVLDKSTPWEKVVLVRSVVATRDMGFLPGTADEKLAPFIAPYIGICDDLFNFGGSYQQLVEQRIIEFYSTSYIRGTTFDNSIIIVDEMQNLTFHELDSVITRVGLDSRIIFAGDFYQSDFTKQSDRNGIQEFLSIIEVMKNFSIIEFGWEDIIRSDFVRDYIMTKEMLSRSNQ